MRRSWLAVAALSLCVPFVCAAQTATSTGMFVDQSTAGATAMRVSGALPPYEPMVSLSHDSQGRGWYVVDIQRFDAVSKNWYWNSRVIIDPLTGEVSDDETALADFEAAPGAVPSGVDPTTHQVLFSVNADDARLYAAQTTNLPIREALAGDVLYDPSDRTWLFPVYFEEQRGADWYFVKTVFVSAYNGTVYTDGLSSLFDLYGLNDDGSPANTDPATKRILTDQGQGASWPAWAEANRVPISLGILGVALAAAAAIVWSRRARAH